jgi:uncharacterized protein YegL
MSEQFVDALPAPQPAKSRLLITLVVDTSYSMAQSGGITELNNALRAWREELQRDANISRIGEIAMVTFGNGHVLTVDASGRTPGRPREPFVPVRSFNPPELTAGGVTPMVEALRFAFEMVAARKQQLRAEGVLLANRPLIYLLTDGAPTDEQGNRSERWRDLAPVIRQHEAGKHLLFFAIGVSGADQDVLRGLAPESNFQVDGVQFGQVLRLVSSSIDSVATAPTRDQPAEEIYADIRGKQARIRDWLASNG